MPTCTRHILARHRWWCRGCRAEVERQFREVCEAYCGNCGDEGWDTCLDACLMCGGEGFTLAPCALCGVRTQ
jgi:hypothetical protein